MLHSMRYDYNQDELSISRWLTTISKYFDLGADFVELSVPYSIILVYDNVCQFIRDRKH